MAWLLYVVVLMGLLLWKWLDGLCWIYFMSHFLFPLFIFSSNHELFCTENNPELFEIFEYWLLFEKYVEKMYSVLRLMQSSVIAFISVCWHHIYSITNWFTEMVVAPPIISNFGNWIMFSMLIEWINSHYLAFLPFHSLCIFISCPCSCSIETVEDMIKMGVYVNDLNLHDSSRELILAGTQQSAELQLALDQVKTESSVSR